MLQDQAILDAVPSDWQSRCGEATRKRSKVKFRHEPRLDSLGLDVGERRVPSHAHGGLGKQASNQPAEQSPKQKSHNGTSGPYVRVG